MVISMLSRVIRRQYTDLLEADVKFYAKIQVSRIDNLLLIRRQDMTLMSNREAKCKCDEKVLLKECRVAMDSKD